MPYAYTDDIAIADLAFRAWGQTLEETSWPPPRPLCTPWWKT